MEALHAYDWPGNVRELENVIQRAMVVADGPMLKAIHLGLDSSLPQELRAPSMDSDISDFMKGHRSSAMAFDIKNDASLATDDTPRAEPSLADRRAMQEAELILATLKTVPTKTLAAARLGISERTLRYKLARLREHGLMAADL